MIRRHASTCVPLPQEQQEPDVSGEQCGDSRRGRSGYGDRGNRHDADASPSTTSPPPDPVSMRCATHARRSPMAARDGPRPAAATVSFGAAGQRSQRQHRQCGACRLQARRPAATPNAARRGDRPGDRREGRSGPRCRQHAMRSSRIETVNPQDAASRQVGGHGAFGTARKPATAAKTTATDAQHHRQLSSGPADHDRPRGGGCRQRRGGPQMRRDAACAAARPRQGHRADHRDGQPGGGRHRRCNAADGARPGDAAMTPLGSPRWPERPGRCRRREQDQLAVMNTVLPQSHRSIERVGRRRGSAASAAGRSPLPSSPRTTSTIDGINTPTGHSAGSARSAADGPSGPRHVDGQPAQRIRHRTNVTPPPDALGAELSPAVDGTSSGVLRLLIDGTARVVPPAPGRAGRPDRRRGAA